MLCPGWQKWHGMFCPGRPKLHGMFCPEWQIDVGCFVQAVKKWHVIFVPGCFVLHSYKFNPVYFPTSNVTSKVVL